MCHVGPVVRITLGRLKVCLWGLAIFWGFSGSKAAQPRGLQRVGWSWLGFQCTATITFPQ